MLVVYFPSTLDWKRIFIFTSKWNDLESSFTKKIVDFSNIVMHSPSHGQWENAGPLSWISVNLVKDQIVLDRV